VKRPPKPPPSPVSHQEKEGSDAHDTNDIENGKQSKPEEGPTSQSVHITDGGAKAWSTVVGGWIICFCSFGAATSFGVFQDLYTLAGASSASNISWVGSLQLFLLFAVGLVAGKLFDLGYFHVTQSVGIFIYLFSTFMLSLVDYKVYYQIFLAQGLGIGIGLGLLFLPAFAIQSHHWTHRRAFAMGIVISGSSFGGIVYPIMMNQLIHHSSLGFAWAVRAMGFMDIVLLLIAKFLMFPNPPPRTDTAGAKPSVRAIITDMTYMSAVIGVFFTLLGLFFPYFYLQLFLDLKGMSRTLAFYSLAIINAGSVPGRLIPNILADKYGRFNILTPVTACTGILLWAMFGIQNNAGMIVFALLYGFFSGAFLSLLPPLIVTLSKDVSEVGIRMGIGFFIAAFANLIGTPIDGALLKQHYPWYKPIVFSGVFIQVGTLFILCSRQLMVKRKGSQMV